MCVQTTNDMQDQRNSKLLNISIFVNVVRQREMKISVTQTKVSFYFRCYHLPFCSLNISPFDYITCLLYRCYYYYASPLHFSVRRSFPALNWRIPHYLVHITILFFLHPSSNLSLRFMVLIQF